MYMYMNQFSAPVNPHGMYFPSIHLLHRHAFSCPRSPDVPLRRPVTPKISVLHRDESGIALASSWTRLSQVRRGQPGGLVQLVDGFLPSWLFTIKSKALFAGTSGSKRTTWPKRDRRRLRRISLIVDRCGSHSFTCKHTTPPCHARPLW